MCGRVSIQKISSIQHALQWVYHPVSSIILFSIYLNVESAENRGDRPMSSSLPKSVLLLYFPVNKYLYIKNEYRLRTVEFTKNILFIRLADIDLIPSSIGEIPRAVSSLEWWEKWNEMNRALGHLCAHIGWTGPGEPSEDGEMIEMTLSSRHRIRNSIPGGLRPSTLPLGHGGSPQY